MRLLDLLMPRKRVTLETLEEVMEKVISQGLNPSRLKVQFPEGTEITQKKDASWRIQYKGYEVITLWKGNGLHFNLERPDGQSGGIGSYIFPSHELALLAGIGAVDKDLAGELRRGPAPACGCVPYERGDFYPPEEDVVPSYWNGIDPYAHAEEQRQRARARDAARVVMWPMSDADYTWDDFRRDWPDEED
jgi:hypothetical protein